jgi:Holliday junction resolvasome RuvABC DNA-binding subunit
VGARGHADETSKLDVAIVRTQAKAALIGLGWKPAIAATAVSAAAADLGPGATLEQWIRAALRWCPRPLA